MEEKSEVDTIFNEEDNDKNALTEINFDVDTGRWLLKVIGGPNNGAEFSMHTASVYTLGTDPASCDIVFHDTSVSRQHARLSIGADDAIAIEDLKSRNGTIVDGEGIKGKRRLEPNVVVTLGTSSFTIYDREGEMQTIISPLLPAIVKVLQNEEPKEAGAEAAKAAALEAEKEAERAAVAKRQKEEAAKEVERKREKTANTVGALIVISIVTGLFVIIAGGTATLFRSEPVTITKEINPMEEVNPILKNFPSVKGYYTPTTGVLQLIGHVVAPSEKDRLLYALQGIPHLKEVDSTGVIVDQYVWMEMNSVLADDPRWKGISLQGGGAGRFVLSGYLQKRGQAEELSDYMASNFAFLDLLDNKVVVGEDLVDKVMSILRSEKLNNITIQMSNGEISLNGKISPPQQESLGQAIAKIREVPGVRGIKNFVLELAPDLALINITDKYDVTGISRLGQNYSVVISGRILGKGDELDGMIIKEIRPNAIFLERDGVKYRIDFSR